MSTRAMREQRILVRTRGITQNKIMSEKNKILQYTEDLFIFHLHFEIYQIKKKIEQKCQKKDATFIKFKNLVSDKGTEFLSQTLIFLSLYLWNPISQTFDLSNYEFCQVTKSKFEISKVWNIGFWRYRDQKIRVCVENSVPLTS